jgi:hypothetical protein
MNDIVYAVHTRKCTYLLDDQGVCRWAVFPGGRVAPSTDRAVGAQFVACLDLRAEGGLLGELTVGGSALFARTEEGRYVLLRTLPIVHVERRAPDDAPFRDDPTEVLPPDQLWGGHAPLDEAPTPIGRIPAFSLPLISEAQEEEGEPLDLEDLLSISVSEVARTMPLYRPPPGAPPPAPWPYAAALPPPRPPPRPPPSAPGSRPPPPVASRPPPPPVPSRPPPPPPSRPASAPPPPPARPLPPPARPLPPPAPPPVQQARRVGPPPAPGRKRR